MEVLQQSIVYRKLHTSVPVEAVAEGSAQIGRCAQLLAPKFIHHLAGHVVAVRLKFAEAPQLTLAPATFGRRTYPAVLACSSRKLAPLGLHLYLTKAEGVVAFDDEYGTLWTRR